MHSVEFATTDSAVFITIDRANLNNATLEQVSGYLRTLIAPIPTAYPSALTASQLRRLPKEERFSILQAQTALVQDYEIIEDDQDIIEDKP